ncbi:MAG TPA: hypothetical protein VIU65_00645 [Pyrinomonadaceae bacterium]
MTDRDEGRLVCPSAQPTMSDPVAFGVILGSDEEPRMTHLERPVPVTDELLALAEPVKPTEVFRFAALCAGDACKHFNGKDCTLVERIVQILPRVATDLPPCAIRSECRWWFQEGRDACLRCPQVITENYNPSEDYMRAADN